MIGKIKFLIEVITDRNFRSFYLQLQKKENRLVYEKLYKKNKEFTMIPEADFIGNILLCEEFRNEKGSLIECGFWGGGISPERAEIFGNKKKFSFFNSFE